ncbi:neurexin-4-like [Dendronephthya gigantea]|uniref:neurexin-4-like n=1 Tax=Dendronephthya gigantea TaxID=151771 RepID=UPI001068F7DC|nr:neurexin-4-like [Dendronephthya gigantea]
MAVFVRVSALIFLLEIFEPGECIAEKRAFFRIVNGRYLANNVIAINTNVTTEFQCIVNCVAHGSCVSVNYKTSGIGKGRCELNNKTLNASDDDESTRNPEFKHIFTPQEMHPSNPQISQNLSTSILTSKNGVGVTEIGHNSELRTFVSGCNPPGCYKRKIEYDISMEQIVAIMNQSKNCEQFIKYECYSSFFHNDYGKKFAWWVSRQGSKMNYWGGAAVDSGKCACGMTNSCVGGGGGRKCNCDKKFKAWREDSGYLTDKNTLPVAELRFGDTGDRREYGYYTLGKLRCWG